MQFSLFTILTVAAHVSALPGLLEQNGNGKCDQAACERFAHESGWPNKVSTSWCTSTATATVTSTDTIYTTDHIYTTDIIYSTDTIYTTGTVYTTNTISVTTTCTETATPTGAWGSHGSGKW